ncbi:MAG: 23S rRNA (adenine(1618)-N(6))-methyltransferase RlmF [Marinomonas sp.]|jgi:23S rRNA (adenine1618-N6)-methyltransferase|uniref:Ribosomal RNA large subunit methyltransferase F n=2 Tax=Marinomonas communis TaxID=28254 RepID=A0A4R6X1B3_9GAMM|nr:23S rRNA (adenine(1618)-N(6))-methyltransferase RlmF [Marinomonas communis]MAF17226.1 23S rRNA (adenine(1618)-N(6))-methyltransferase RlmF [Marinomonas sp.]MCC4274210.1 23S rRNA (adenine(1618)-N(6))-methyltransferase RlmF [Marinomonas communis]TDR06178.1 23S rRNA m(6)A-1618 methyltransferase [Marinomonas communis]
MKWFNPHMAKKEHKLTLHPRNPHRARYNFSLLADSCPELAPYIQLNQYGTQTIDFSDPNAVKVLNRALLNHFYGVLFWDIPEGYLCPPIPGRADYIHYLADLLADSNAGQIPRGRGVKALDVGTGANCVYPIIGSQEYGWQFIGSDANNIAVQSAQAVVDANPSLKKRIQLRHQSNMQHVFAGIWQQDEVFDVTLCNPPFHPSQAAMTSENKRKWRGVKGDANKTTLNFGGQAPELWCEGGETGFISRMIKESVDVKDRCFWFTSLVARKENLAAIYRVLKSVGAVQVKTIEMAQGQKISRFVAWSFLEPAQIDFWRDTRWRK